MKLTLLAVFVAAFASNSFAAESKITPELATIKSSHYLVTADWLQGFDLGKVTAASSVDSGKTIMTTIEFTATITFMGSPQPATCSAYAWYKYDGSPAQCDSCNDNPNCACATAACQVGGKTYYR